MSNEIVYELPDSWTWTTIGEISILRSGGTPDRKNLSFYRGTIPWVKSGELNYNTITQTIKNKLIILQSRIPVLKFSPKKLSLWHYLFR